MPISLRRPTLDDAPGLLALINACDIAAIGVPDSTLNDVRDMLNYPDMDLEKDAWLAFDGEALVGFGLAQRQADGDIVEVDMHIAPHAGLDAAQLWDPVEARALDIARSLGHPRARLDIGIHRADEPKRAVATARGYEPATAFYRMRIDHAGTVPTPQLPPGVSLEVAGDDERLRRTAVDIDNAAFTEHFGFVAYPYESWAAKFESSAMRSWDLARVLSVDGEPAAVLIENLYFIEDEDCGHVGTLGVLKEFRGRGFGRLLLLDAFARDCAAGRTGTLLHVDANNLTPALGLYEKAGMRQVLVIDVWRRTVDVPV